MKRTTVFTIFFLVSTSHISSGNEVFLGTVQALILTHAKSLERLLCIYSKDMYVPKKVNLHPCLKSIQVYGYVYFKMCVWSLFENHVAISIIYWPRWTDAIACSCCGCASTVRVFKIVTAIRKPFCRWAGILRQTQTRKT